MKKTLKIMLFIIAYICFIIVLSYCISGFSKCISLVTGNYPAVGNYYISFSADKNETISANVYYKQDIYDEAIDLSNLEIYVKKNVGYYIDKKDIYNDKQIRKMLLQEGLAKIIDKNIATKEEISYQTKAIKEENGIWNTGENKKNYISLHSIFDKIILFSGSNLGEILKWIIFTGVGLSTIYCFIKKKISKRKIDIVLMGGISSGKTTILRRMEKPNITEGKLLAEATTTKTEQIVKCDRIAYKNKDIYPYLFDNQGDKYGEMIDAINKFGIKKSDKKVMIYVISFTKANSLSDFDYKLANSQISKAAVLVKSFKTSRSLKKVNRIIIFFNKCDLLYSSESEFLKNKIDIENKYYKETTDFQEIKDYADAIIYGSALKGWGIEELKEEILSIK